MACSHGRAAGSGKRVDHANARVRPPPQHAKCARSKIARHARPLPDPIRPLRRFWSRATDRCSRGQQWAGRALCPPDTLTSGATAIPRKPNYDFERRERERTKAAEAAKKAQAKAEKRAAQQDVPEPEEPSGAQDR